MKSVLYKQLEPCLGDFRFAKLEKKFVRDLGNKADIIGLAIIERGSLLEIEPFIGVRFPKIEDIILAESGLYGVPNKLSFTVGIRLPGERFSYGNESEASQVAAGVASRARESGELFSLASTRSKKSMRL